MPFGDKVLNNRCWLLRVASQQLNMEETSRNYGSWNRAFFFGDDGQRVPDWDKNVNVAFNAKTLGQKSFEALPRLRALQDEGQDECSVPIHLLHRDAYVEMVENHLLASVRGNGL